MYNLRSIRQRLGRLVPSVERTAFHSAGYAAPCDESNSRLRASMAYQRLDRARPPLGLGTDIAFGITPPLATRSWSLEDSCFRVSVVIPAFILMILPFPGPRVIAPVLDTSLKVPATARVRRRSGCGAAPPTAPAAWKVTIRQPAAGQADGPPGYHHARDSHPRRWPADRMMQRRIDLSQRDRSRLFVAYKKGRPERRPSDPDGSC